ncbi:MAG: hypothetical protein ACYTGQ_00860 [Planctomycetota bacterium]
MGDGTEIGIRGDGFAGSGAVGDSVPMLDLFLFNGVALWLAVTWALCLRMRPLCLAPLALVVTHVLVIQAWVMVTGLAGGLDVGTWRWVSMGAGLVGVGVWWVAWDRLTVEWAVWTGRVVRVLRLLGAWRVIGMGVLLGVMACWVAVTGWLVGPNIPDVLNYYLVPPTDWVADGALTTRNWRDPRAMWPQGHGLMAAWWMAGCGSLRASVFAELHWLALALGGVWALTRRLGGSVRQATAALLLMCGVPVVWAQCTSGLNDLGVSALAIAALACVCAGRLTMKSVGSGLLVVIVGVGVKPTMAFLGVGVVIVGVGRLIAGRAFDRSGRVGGALWLMLILATLTGSYWYARNTVETGNPFYPQAVFVGGEKVLEGHDYLDNSGGGFSLKNLRTNMFDLFYEKVWDSYRISTGQTERGSGFGPIGSALGLSALLGLLLFVREARPVVIALALMTLLLAAGVNRDPWNGRFFAFVALAGAAAIVLLWVRIGPEIARMLWGLMAATAWGFGVWYALGLTVPGFPGGISRGQVWGYWFERGVGPTPLAVTLPMHPTTYLAGAVKDVPRGATIALVYPRGIKGPAALMHGEDLSRRLIYLHDALPTLDRLYEWRDQGVGWVLVMEDLTTAVRVDSEMVNLGLQPEGPSLYRIPGIPVPLETSETQDGGADASR